jgi:hypothetical protein
LLTEIDLPTQQVKRRQSAEKALSNHLWTIFDVPGGWLVRTPNDTYTITPCADGGLSCSCPDHQRYGPYGLDCKHIIGLLILLEDGGVLRISSLPQKGTNKMTTDTPKECGWVRLYHPSAAQVTIPLHLDNPISETDARTLLASVANLITAGFAVDAPGLEDGEHIEEIGFIVRRSKANTDGSETPVVDLYPLHGNFRLLGKYMNNEADLNEFEAACGVQLSYMSLYEGDNTIERGKNPKMEKYVVPLKRPVKVIWKMNPRYEGENDKKNSKRLFIRWAEMPLAADSNQVLTSTGKLDLEEAKSILCPMGSKSHPELKGLPLGQVAQIEDGRKVLEYLASSQYQPNGNPEGQRAKAAANLLLESMQPA